MNKQTNRTLLRALITVSAGAFIALSQTNCTGSDGEPKRHKGSLFNRAKNSNSFIDDGIQTTRRDRLAAQNGHADFDLQPYPTEAGRKPVYDAATMMDPTPPGPLTPNSDLELDPDPRMTTRSSRPEDNLSLPSLDSDFPPPNQPEAADPYPDPNLRRRVASDDGYIPLQPKLPSQETIVPPNE